VIHSPTYRSGLLDARGCALVQPAKLAWGLKKACLDLGVRIFERTPVRAMRREGSEMVLSGDLGRARAGQVALGTNAFPSLVRRVRMYTIPVYDYVLMTEPLTDEQLASVGWKGRQAVMDSGNQFHYYRLTADNRMLWGGYDAIYYFGKRIRPEQDQRMETHLKLAEHFLTTFPQLRGVRFTHRWGGAIDTCTRFSAFFGTAHGGRVAYAAGFTGLGVGATRFGADVMLDLLGGEDTERTRLEMVQTMPLPFPPEPVSYLGVQATRASLARADRNGGQRNLWLRALDKVGLGFDS
jgi:glycine/D-amino acid oxidase-like deaminating enzyme